MFAMWTHSTCNFNWKLFQPNPFTPNIWLLILLHGSYRFPCKLITSSIKIKLLPDKFEYSRDLFAEYSIDLIERSYMFVTPES